MNTATELVQPAERRAGPMASNESEAKGQREQHLASVALELAGRNELIQRIAVGLQRMLGAGTSEASQMIGELLQDIEDSLRFIGGRNRLEGEVRLAHRDFLNALAKRCPTITPTELLVCSLTRINLPTRSIASLLLVSTRNIETHRHRLRKKLGLPTGINLTVFLSTLE